MDSMALALVNHDPASLQLTGPNSTTAVARSAQASGANGPAMRNIPAFLNKLYNMVNDPATDDLIRWTESGTSFTVPSAEKFGKEMLPRFFKHSNFGSFVRQLNMYGFHKVPHLQQGVLKHDKEDDKEKAEILEFRNDNFQRDQPDLLYLIQRKKGGGPSGGRDDSEGPADLKVATGQPAAGSGSGSSSLSKFQGDLSQLLGEVQAIKRHQTILSTELRELQNSNRQLWQENLEHRAKHEKNQDMIDKIFKFLAGVFGGRALNEGTAFSNGNIAAADSMSGLGLGSYGQSTGGPSNGTSGMQSNVGLQGVSGASSDFDALNGPRKRRRLLLGSPEKDGSVKTSSGQHARAPSSSGQFEEILSEEEDAPTIGGPAVSGGSRVRSISTSPSQPPPFSSFDQLDPSLQQQPPNTAPLPLSTAVNAPSTLLPSTNATGAFAANSPDLSGIDWTAMNAYLNSGNAGELDFTSPSFLNNFSLANSNVAQSNPPSSTTAPYSMALSPRTSTFNNQALAKYAAPPPQDQEVQLKKRLDSLGEQLDKLVAQLPPHFAGQYQGDSSGFGNGDPAEFDDFDFSQYLDPTDAYADLTLPENGQNLSSSLDPTDPLSQYLDPALNGSSLGESVPVGQGDAYANLPEHHEQGSEQPAQSSSTELSLEDLIKDEPAPTPTLASTASTATKDSRDGANNTTPVASAKEEVSTPKYDQVSAHPQTGGKAPKKAPAAAAAIGGKTRKRTSDQMQLAPSPAGTEDASETASNDGTRRSTRSTRGKK